MSGGLESGAAGAARSTWPSSRVRLHRRVLRTHPPHPTHTPHYTAPHLAPLPTRFYALEGPPKGSLMEDLCLASVLPGVQCEHLRVPAWEYSTKVKKGKGRLKEHLKAKERAAGPSAAGGS